MPAGLLQKYEARHERVWSHTPPVVEIELATQVPLEHVSPSLQRRGAGHAPFKPTSGWQVFATQ